MILKDYATTVAGLEVESSNDDLLLDASTPDVQNQNSDSSFLSSRITDLSTISVSTTSVSTTSVSTTSVSTTSVSTTSVVPVLTQDAKDASTDVSLLSRGVVATSVISQTEAAVSQIHVSYPSFSTFSVKSSKIISTITPAQDSFTHRASSVTFDLRTDSKLTFSKSNLDTTSAPSSTTTASNVHMTSLSHTVEKMDSTSSEVDLSTVTELSRTVKPKPSSSQSASDVAVVTYNLSSSTSPDVTEVRSSATSLLAPDGIAMQSQSSSLVSHFDDHDTTSQNVLIDSFRMTTSAVTTTDSFTTSSFVPTDFPTTTTTLVKSSSSQTHSVSTGQATTQPIMETSSASEKLTTDSRTSSRRQEKVTSVHVSSTERQEAESTVIPKTNFPFYYDSQSLRLDLSWITSEHSSSNYTTSAKANGSIDSTAVASGSVGVALYVSLSLVFGLGVILIISFVVLCLLRNYCRQFHRCCSKHPGRCRFKNSCPCVETCPYHGLQPQRLTETPDLISESVHAQITRIRRGSSHPDEIALLERSLEHSDSLNELDQFVFEDPDLMTPSSSDLFIDCRLASTCDRTPELNSRDFPEDRSDMSRSSRLNRSGRPRKNIMGACFGGGSGAHDFMHQSHRDFQDDGFGCGGGHDAIVVENPYLKPSCHAHVEPGPNSMPFHPYDPVYVPHHDPVGMARRLDKEGKYVTSPRLRMRNQVYEELGRNVRDQYRTPVNRLPPVVPNRSATAVLGGFAPVVPMRVSSRQSPRVPIRGASLERSAKSPPVAPMRISSRASPVVQSKGASLERRFRSAAQVAPVQVSLPPSPPSGAAFNEGPIPPASSRVSSRTAVDPLLDRCLPELPIAQHSREPSTLSTPGSQRDSTSSSTTIPGHEYSRVDFGNRDRPDPVVTTVEVEPYETDSDSCRDGAYESIDFPKSPPSP